MADALTTRLMNPQQARNAFAEAWDTAKAMLIAGNRMVLVLREEKRSLDQNAHFHALCSDIAKSGIAWAGKPRKASEWKALLVSGHAVATKAEVEMVPGLENEFVNLRESTAQMGVKRAASLIEYTHAFMAENGVPIQAGKQWEGWE